MNPIILSTAGGAAPSGKYVAVSSTVAPGVTMYTRNGDVLTKLADPASPPGESYDVSFSPEGGFLALGIAATPFSAAYRRDGDSLTRLTVATPTSANLGIGIALGPDGTHMAVANFSGPADNRLILYKRSGTAYSLLPTASPDVTGGATGAAEFTKDGAYVAVVSTDGGDGTNYLNVFKRAGDVFSRLISTIIEQGPRRLAFSADGVYLTVTIAPTPVIFKRTGDAFARLPAIPAVSGWNVGTQINGAAFSPDGTYMLIGASVAPYVVAYKRSGDTFTRLADPAGTLAAGCFGLTFMGDDYFAAALSATPFIALYKRTGDAFAKLADPAALPTGASTSIASF